jgi:hypothetical protein
MTIQKLVLETMHLPAAVAAERIGVSTQDIYARRWLANNADRVRQRARQRYQRTREIHGRQPRVPLEANPFWRERDAKLIEMVKAGNLRRHIAEELGTTKNAVIGRWNRLVEAGLA